MKVYKPVGATGIVMLDNTKPIYVADDLNKLRGPTTGWVSLPVYLDWSHASDYDMSNPVRVHTMYSIVLQEAGSEEDLAEYVNAGILVREWEDLSLPDFIRETWEQHHPALR